MTTATMTRARRLVTQEERAERQARIERKAATLQAEAVAEQARQQQERARERVTAAEAEAMEVAPVVTLTYADVQVRIALRGRDEVERQVISEAVSRASRIFAAGAAGEAYRGDGWRGDSTFLIVDATPPDAQVYLDGRRLGLAGELVARALPVSYGRHTVHVLAPGYRPWAAQFVADGSFPVRLRTELTRE